MFTGTLAFIIFAGSEFALQSKQIGDQIKVGSGGFVCFFILFFYSFIIIIADLVFSAGSTSIGITEEQINNGFNKARDTFGDIVGFFLFSFFFLLVWSSVFVKGSCTYRTFSLTQYGYISQVRIGNLNNLDQVFFFFILFFLFYFFIYNFLRLQLMFLVLKEII
jgi:hypothetical protein